jgi:hypothetical protein
MAAGADHCTVPSATLPLGEICLLLSGVTTAETWGIDLTLAIAESMTLSRAGSATFAVPRAAKTIVVWPPLNAGSLA